MSATTTTIVEPGSTPATAPAAAVLLKRSGQGDATTRHFTAPGPWKVGWTWHWCRGDCLNHPRRCTFDVAVVNADGSISLPAIADDTGAGHKDYSTPGRYSLSVHFACDTSSSTAGWTVTVTD